jgi:flotillin
MKFLGEAEAFAIEAKAKAEAEQMAKKAEAWGEYKEAALVEMILQVMPKLAAEIAGNFSFFNNYCYLSHYTWYALD